MLVTSSAIDNILQLWHITTDVGLFEVRLLLQNEKKIVTIVSGMLYKEHNGMN